MSKHESDKGSGWEGVLLSIAVIIVVFGAVVMLVSYLVAEKELKIGYIGAGAGIISIGVGFLAIWLSKWLSKKSDAKMTSIANLEFDEKGAMIEGYEAFFSQNFDKTEFEKFRWDLEAITHVSRWADKEKRERISRSVDNIASSVNNKVTKDSLERIKALSSKIRD